MATKKTTKKIPENLANKDVPKYYKWTYTADDGKIVGSNISQQTAYSYLINRNNKYAESQSAKTLQTERDTAAQNNAWSAQEAQKNRDWQEEMSNTAHQREVKDLVAAGLNPILSANNGAATGTGAVGSVDTGATGTATQQQIQKMSLKNQRDMAELNAGIQLQMNKENIASAQKMAKWTNALQRELGYAQLINNKEIANISAGASAYAARQAAAAAMYGANQSYAASVYGSNQSYAASKYATDNPSSMWGLINQFLSGNANSSKSVSGIAGKIIKGIQSSAKKKSNSKSGKYK